MSAACAWSHEGQGKTCALSMHAQVALHPVSGHMNISDELHHVADSVYFMISYDRSANSRCIYSKGSDATGCNRYQKLSGMNHYCTLAGVAIAFEACSCTVITNGWFIPDSSFLDLKAK